MQPEGGCWTALNHLNVIKILDWHESCNRKVPSVLTKLMQPKKDYWIDLNHKTEQLYMQLGGYYIYIIIIEKGELMLKQLWKWCGI